jgi:diketogulonate reductase-like aldo/keto reductase
VRHLVKEMWGRGKDQHLEGRVLLHDMYDDCCLAMNSCDPLEHILLMQAQDNHEAVVTSSCVVSEPEDVMLRGGARMPLLGLGTFRIQDASVVTQALEIGYRHIDCARIYGNEDVVGEGLKDFLAAGEEARRSLWITSKVWNDSHRPEDVVKSVDATLKDLGCGYLDLLLIHWPEAWLPGTEEPDTTVTIKDTYQAMERLVGEGKVRFLGVSNFSLAQIEDILSWCTEKPVVNQIELHPMLPQRKLVGVSCRKGVHSVAYSPLGVGGEELLNHPTVTKIAQETGKSNAHVLLKWNVQRGVAVIPKASSEKHLRDNFVDLFSWRLTWDQKAALDALEKPGKRFIDPSFHVWADVEEGGAKKPSAVFNY